MKSETQMLVKFKTDSDELVRHVQDIKELHNISTASGAAKIAIENHCELTDIVKNKNAIIEDLKHRLSVYQTLIDDIARVNSVVQIMKSEGL